MAAEPARARRRGRAPRPAGVQILILAAGLAPAIALARAPVNAGPSQAQVKERLADRELVLVEQERTATATAQRRARKIYRMSRFHAASFATDPAKRLGETRALGDGLFALRRDLRERLVLRAELERLRADRAALVSGSTVSATGAAAADAAGASEAPSSASPRFLRPVLGPLVGRFGSTREPTTGAELRRGGVLLLARGGEPVRALEDGKVRRVERAATGGFSVVISHPGGWTSIVSGLREAALRPGDPISRGDTVGAVGRTLDGAAVLGVELWRGRTAVDPTLVWKKH